MNTSFYTAARGAMTEQDKLNVVANNVANVNTTGYKSKRSIFRDLMHYNMRASVNEQTNLTAGSGVVQTHTNTDFAPSGFIQTGGKFDYAINGEGFFMLRDPATNAVTYARAGSFSVSDRQGTFYLVSDSGSLVLDKNGNPIQVVDDELQAEIGVYGFNNTDGMESVGDNEFIPVAKNGNPILLPDAQVINGSVEMSNVDLAGEIAKTIEASRAYSYALKMVQTSDEVEQTINGLRG